jgi:hypothetical protein
VELAHNCILIHQPGEPFADYWGQECNDPEGKVNYGGMNRTAGGGRVAAFGTNHLHLIQVGDRSLPGMTEAKLLEADGIVGVSFQADDRSVSVLFGAVGGPSGHIRIAARGANLTDKELARSVMPQAGIGSPENPL